MLKSKLIASVGALVLASGVAQAQDSSALLDLLVKKKVITDQEAEEVRADLVKEYANTSAGKINISNSITEMRISGDIRERFQYENGDYEAPPTVTAPIAGALPQWQGNRGPIFAPDAKGAFYRDAQGNFHEIPAGYKVYEGSNGKVYVVKATDPKPNRTSAAKTYARYNAQPTKANQGGQQDRWRFRLRLRDEFELAGGWFGGVELSTSSASDSGNQTYGARDASGIGGGGFDKYGIFISKVYMGWNASDWASIVVGKQTNPFYTTDLVWDPDINPDGLVEQIKFNRIYLGGSQGGAGGSQSPEERPWKLALNMGQFIFSDNIENGLVLTEPGFSSPSAVHHDYSNDAYLFEFQLQGSYRFANNVKATFAPAFMFYDSARVSGANNSTAFTDIGSATYINRQTTFFGETRDLKILTAPGEVSFNLGSLPVKLLWDFAYNFEGRQRDEKIYGMFYYDRAGRVTSYHTLQDDIAWLAGFQFGENKKQGDWSLLANFRQTGISSVDPNLNDSDFANGKLNIQGLKVAATYNFTDYATGSATYFWATALRNNMVGGQATQGANLANLNNIQIFQLELQMKF